MYQVSKRTVEIIKALAPPHHPTVRAPSTYAELVEVWNRAQPADKRGFGCGSLPVFSGNCERTIYGSREANWAFRAWHDRLHVQLQAGFDRVGEERVARSQVMELERAGADESDVLAVWYDVAGQFLYAERFGGFPEDQASFVALCMLAGIDTALRDGVRFRPQVAA